MKKVLFFVLAMALLAGCASNEFEGDQALLESGSGEITFSMSTPNTTRASGGGTDLTGSAAATKLGNEFVVYGWKTTAGTTPTNSVVFDNYTLKYTDGSSNQTLSNTSGWEYVGYTTQPFAAGEAGVEQFIKYWDYSASQYDFLAWRINGGSAIIEGLKTLTDAEKKEGTESNYYKDTALVFQVPSADDLAKIYIANRVTKLKSSDYNKEVEFSFRNLSAKVRLGIYETVPGYSVKEVKFYESADASANVGVPTLYLRSNSGFAIPKAGNVLVKYKKSDNAAVAKTTPGDSTRTFTNGTGLNYQGAEKFEASGNSYLGRTSNTSTYPTGAGDDNGYTYAFPHDTAELYLKVDYTLVSLDGKKEEIKVTGATAVVPRQYGKWEANYAYTYLFKISDKTSGSTGGTGDPEGLYPITFDAVVINTDYNNQETVTTVSTPTITTYQGGKNVTENDEYLPNEDIDVKILDQSTSPYTEITLTKDNFKLYSAVSTDGTLLTEANVANYRNNGIVLTDVSRIIKNYASLNAAKVTFTAETGKTYVAEYTSGSDKYYKVIKVSGTIDTPSYTIKTYAYNKVDSAISAVNEGDKFYVKVYEDSTACPVTGAAKDFSSATLSVFDVEETTDSIGKYQFTAKAGTTQGSHTIQIADKSESESITVNAYEFKESSVILTADSTTTNVDTLYLAGVSADTTGMTKDGNFTVPTGVKIVSIKDGGIVMIASRSAVDGTLQFKKDNVVLAEATITIQQYGFTPASAIINCGSIDEAGSGKCDTLQLLLDGDPIQKKVKVTQTANNVLSTNIADSIQTDTNGKFTLTAGSTSGTATVTAPGGNTASIEVTNFTVDVSGDASQYTVTFRKDGTAVNADLTPSAGTLTNTGTGTYSWTGTIETGATIKYTYKSTKFTLYKKQ